MKVESVTFNENKLIQEWVDHEIKYPYTPQDLGNRKYRQTIARTGFTEDIISELLKRGFTLAQVDKNIKQVRQRFGFHVRKTGKRGKQTSPANLLDIVFTEGRRGAVPTTTSATVSTASSVTPATSSTGETISSMGPGTGTIGQTIGSITIADLGSASGERGRLPIIATVFSMSTSEGAYDPEEQGMELEYVSTVTKDPETSESKSKTHRSRFKN